MATIKVILAGRWRVKPGIPIVFLLLLAPNITDRWHCTVPNYNKAKKTCSFKTQTIFLEFQQPYKMRSKNWVNIDLIHCCACQRCKQFGTAQRYLSMAFETKTGSVLHTEFLTSHIILLQESLFTCYWILKNHQVVLR